MLNWIDCPKLISGIRLIDRNKVKIWRDNGILVGNNCSVELKIKEIKRREIKLFCYLYLS
jgi:hypothetical protein